MTQKGWNHYKESIKTAFESSENKRGTWADFVKHATEHFQKEKTANAKRKNELIKQVDEFYAEEKK